MLYFSKCGFEIGSTLLSSFKRNHRKKNEKWMKHFMILHDRKIYIEVWTFKQHKNATTTKCTTENTSFWALKNLNSHFDQQQKHYTSLICNVAAKNSVLCITIGPVDDQNWPLRNLLRRCLWNFGQRIKFSWNWCGYVMKQEMNWMSLAVFYPK